MSGRVHLRLIVSEPPVEADGEPQERVSTIQTVAAARRRYRWVQGHGRVLAMWAASITLLAFAFAMALGWR